MRSLPGGLRSLTADLLLWICDGFWLRQLRLSLPLMCPAFGQTILAELSGLVHQLRPIAGMYLDGMLIGPAESTTAAACTVTLIGYSTPRDPANSSVVPAVLDTCQALSERSGFRRFSLSGLSLQSTSSTTTTTTFPLPDTGSQHVAAISDYWVASGSVDPPTNNVAQQATNPDLLDFLRDELAISRIRATELPGAFTLFDAALQTRLAVKGPNWGVVDCLQAARLHFAHLGQGVRLHVVRDLVEGLPSPQIAATPDRLPAHWFTLPIDARPAGRGICVIDAAGTATPFSAAFQAGSQCNYEGLHQQIARRDCVMRAARRHLQPFEEIATRGDSVSVAFFDVPFHVELQHRDAIPARVFDAVQDLRDLANELFAQDAHAPIAVHWPGGRLSSCMRKSIGAERHCRVLFLGQLLHWSGTTISACIFRRASHAVLDRPYISLRSSTIPWILTALCTL